jgi:hypothetical protein
MISQFILGLYTIVYTTPQGGECMTKCRPQFLPTSTFQWYRSHRSHFGFMGSACSCNIGTWKSGLPLYLSYLVRKFPSSSTKKGDTYCNHPTDLLAFSLIVYLVLRSNSEIPIPKPNRPIRLCPNVLRHPKQPHHQIVHFHVLEPIHNVNVIRGRVPALVLVRHPGLVVEGFHDVRERTMGDEHCVHPEVSVVVSVVLREEI